MLHHSFLNNFLGKLEQFQLRFHRCLYQISHNLMSWLLGFGTKIVKLALSSALHWGSRKLHKPDESTTRPLANRSLFLSSNCNFWSSQWQNGNAVCCKAHLQRQLLIKDSKFINSRWHGITSRLQLQISQLKYCWISLKVIYLTSLDPPTNIGATAKVSAHFQQLSANHL